MKFFHCLSLGLLVSAPGWAQDTWVQSQTTQQLIATGRESFVHNCSGCHGMDAQGSGPAAPMLSPKPRNLVSGAFKFRSTPTGTYPTTSDLLRTLDQGVLGTSMPSFRLMAQAEKFALVTYIKSLRPDWKEMEGSPILLPDPPKEIFGKKATLLASAAEGRKIFFEACQSCHGDKALGDGPGAEGLTDAENRPIRPANLNRPFVKSGRSARDVFKVISTGIDGTPMPSFAEVYNEEKRWQLVSYVFFLRGKTLGIYPADLELPGSFKAPEAPKAAAPAPAPKGDWN